MYKSAATLLALALATTHGLDEGHNVQKKDASKGLRGSVGRKLSDEPVCSGKCYPPHTTPWSTKCEWGADYKSWGGCKDCPECETTEAHKEDYDGPYNGPLSKKCEPRFRERHNGYVPCEVSTEEGGRKKGGAYTKVCDDYCTGPVSTTAWSKKCDVDYTNKNAQCSDCRECVLPPMKGKPSTELGTKGAICNGPCYAAHTTFWSKKCEPDYVHGCEGCPECAWKPGISKTSGKRGAVDKVCSSTCNPAGANWETKCKVGHAEEYGCNGCPECEFCPNCAGVINEQTGQCGRC